VRVALVSPYSLSYPGGVQGQVLALARALEAAGHEPVVLGPVDGPVPHAPEGLVSLGRSVPVPANGSTARLALGPVPQTRAARALARLRPDVVHLHEPLAPGPTWACLLRSEPKVGTFHRAGTVAGGRFLAPAASRLAARLAARTAVSDEARATAEAVAGGDDSDYRVIGNGVELDRFESADPWPTPRPVVLFVGRHEPRKGLGVLLDAFCGLDGELGATLWVAGQGPATDDLRRRFAGRTDVEWLGVVDDDELAARMVAASVVCAPSLGGESFGVVLVEAMAARAVVVASALAGYGAVVGDHGLLVPPGDVAALRIGLDQALRDAQGGDGYAAPSALDAAATRAAQWSMTEVAARYVEVYEAVHFAGHG